MNYYTDPLVTLYLGDCIDVMRGLPDASVDSVVTDPPYGLEFMGKEWDRIDIRQPGDANYQTADNPYGRSKVRHSSAASYGVSSAKAQQAWHEQWATEAFRVLKPGGYLLAFGGTRTYHRLASAIEDAGFEIRDTLMWIYASGFPKSLRVNSDPRFCQCESQTGASVASDVRIDLEPGEGDRTSTDRPSASPDAGVRSPSAPTATRTPQGSRAGYRRAHGSDDGQLLLDGADAQASAPLPADAPARSRSSGLGDDPSGLGGTHSRPGRNGLPSKLDSQVRSIGFPCLHCSKPIADGLGTALKPAHEPIVMARKPLVGTVAANVTRYGTGALNIDGTRIAANETLSRPPSGDAFAEWSVNNGGQKTHHRFGKTRPPKGEPPGRWPSNVLLSDPELFDEPNPWVVGSGVVPHNQDPATRGSTSAVQGVTGFSTGGKVEYEPTDAGYSRFFIIPKADRAERERGLAGREVERSGESTWAGECNVCGSRMMLNGKTQCGHDDMRWVQGKARANVHPTVKPIDLMRHLVRLVTPPGGVTLDPFAGSGTTGLAASEEGIKSILIEREPEYVEIIKGRLVATPMGLGLDVPAPTSKYRPPAKMPPIRHDQTTEGHWGWYDPDSDEEPAA